MSAYFINEIHSFIHEGAVQCLARGESVRCVRVGGDFHDKCRLDAEFGRVN